MPSDQPAPTGPLRFFVASLNGDASRGIRHAMVTIESGIGGQLRISVERDGVPNESVMGPPGVIWTVFARLAAAP